MHGLILADIEGIVGIENFLDDVKNSKEIYTREIEVYINALLRNDVKKITVCDSHSKGDMILPRVISNKVNLVSRTENISFDINYDFAIMVGYHGMSESPGIFPHTLRFDFKHIRIGEIPIGEVELYSRWLGHHGIPVILVTGDREATYEANCFNAYRNTCCSRSKFVKKEDAGLIYRKLSLSVDMAMQLDKNKCLSIDDDETSIEFYNPDNIGTLETEGYKSKNGRLIFKNCTDIVSHIFSLVESMNRINAHYLEINSEFLKNIRELAKNFSREDVEKTNIMPLLRKNLMFLDEESKKEIMSALQKLAFQPK